MKRESTQRGSEIASRGGRDMNSDSEKDEEELADQVFIDKDSDYSPGFRSRAVTAGSYNENKKQQLNEKACDILKIPVEFRKPEEEDTLVKAFKTNVFLKSSYADTSTYGDFILNCSRSFKYEIYPAGAAVFHYGEMGDKFYIILKGMANIYVPKAVEDYETEFDKYIEVINSKFGKNQQTKAVKYIEKLKNAKQKLTGQTGESLETLARRVLSQSSRKEKRKSSVEFLEYFQNLDIHNSPEIELLKGDHRTSKLYICDGFCRFKVVKKLLSSDYFGELALSLSKPRAASVFAETPLHLATLKKEDFAKIFDRQINELNKKVHFFQTQFPNCSKDALVKFSYEFKTQNFSHCSYLFKEGDPPNVIYLIKSGQIQLLKKKTSASKIPALGENAMQIKFREHDMIFIASLTEGQFLGEEDAFFGRQRSYSALAIQNVEVYVIHTETLMGMKRSQSDLVKIIADRAETKEKWRIERINNLKNVKEISNSQIARMNRLKTRKNRKLIGLRSMDQIFDSALQQSIVNNKTVANVQEAEKPNPQTVIKTEGSDPMASISDRGVETNLQPTGNYAIRGRVLNSEEQRSEEFEQDNLVSCFGKAKITYELIPEIVRRNRKFMHKVAYCSQSGSVKFSNPFFNVPTLSNSLKKLKKELEQKKRKPVPQDWIGDNFQSKTKDLAKMIEPLTVKKDVPGYMTLKQSRLQSPGQSESKLNEERYKSEGDEGTTAGTDLKPQRARSIKTKIRKGVHSLKPSYFTEIASTEYAQTQQDSLIRDSNNFRSVLQPEIPKSEPPRLTFISSKHNMFRIKPTKTFLMSQAYKTESRRPNFPEESDPFGGTFG